ncbi:MAG: type II toxin-antitoxin system VapC family toxin [Candidatus Competibacteraceae bacterium]|nr:type II toxin-antitoxin system VapC family toxin [Candidatus Competibacteraceae bacterium]
MVVDSAAAVALLKSEPGWEALASRLHAAASRVLSVAGWVELSLVVAGRHGDATTLDFLDRFLQAAAIELHPVDESQARLAREAFLRFGKGRHPASLNFGDCFSYALGRTLDAPLLFVGDDFGRTDVRAALAVQE